MNNKGKEPVHDRYPINTPDAEDTDTAPPLTVWGVGVETMARHETPSSTSALVVVNVFKRNIFERTQI